MPRSTHTRRILFMVCIVHAGCNPATVPFPDLGAAETDCASFRLSVEYIQKLHDVFQQSATAAELAALQDTVLLTVPPELRDVVEHREQFTDLTGLEDITTGTVIDTTDALDGCWGRIDTVIAADGSVEWINASVLLIDLDARRYEMQDMLGIDGLPCTDDARPLIRVQRAEVLGFDADHLRIRISGDTMHSAAGLAEDGQLIFDPVALYGVEFNAGFEFMQRFTVDANRLKTAEGEAWSRLACPGEAGQSDTSAGLRRRG